MPTNSRRQAWELESILETVRVSGMAIVNRYKIAALLGRERERREIWAELREKYEEVGGDPDQLRGGRVGESLILTRFELTDDPYTADPIGPEA